MVFFLPASCKRLSLIYISVNQTSACTIQDTPAGTVSLNYTVSNIKFKVEDTSSNAIAQALSASPLNFSYQEWYWQQYPLTPSLKAFDSTSQQF